jgi:acetyl-CoA C-acetyltransferase
MERAVIVSTARTPIAKAFKGSFNATHGVTLAGHVVDHAVERSGVERERIEDVVLGCGMPEGATGMNIGRHAAMRAGLSQSVAGATVMRACASGLNAIAVAAQQIMVGGAEVLVAGGVESISLVQPLRAKTTVKEQWLEVHSPDIYLPMNDTAQVVATRYNISRQEQDEYALMSQMRTASAQKEGRFDAEIVSLRTTKTIEDPKTGAITTEEVELLKDEGNRPTTTLESLSALKPIKDGYTITAGNASQLSDGASAAVLVSDTFAEKNGLKPMGAFVDFCVAGNDPAEMGIAPVFAIPKLLKRNKLTVSDIELWEINEAYACQTLYIAQHLSIPLERLNVDGGAISVGHPFGMTGARQVGHILLEGRRRKAKYAVVTMCVAGGMGAAALLEVF